MKNSIPCPLCSTLIEQSTFKSLERFFFQCRTCELIFLDPKDHLEPTKEKSRYEEHNNDIEDSRYQDFVRPLLLEITTRLDPAKSGLDFGAGTGPVLTHLLKKAGYAISLYDPFFHPDKTVLKDTYDFVFATEVVEHFFQPQKEFLLLTDLTKDYLFLMTLLYTANTELTSWYYLRDPTHVCAFSEKTFRWIQNRFGYSHLEIKAPRIVILKK